MEQDRGQLHVGRRADEGDGMWICQGMSPILAWSCRLEAPVLEPQLGLASVWSAAEQHKACTKGLN